MAAFQIQSRPRRSNSRSSQASWSSASLSWSFQRKETNPTAASLSLSTTARLTHQHDIFYFDTGLMATAPSSTLSAATMTTTETATTFEPILPDTTALIGFASIVLLSAVAGWVWANQVVPVSRTKLALSKKNGPVKDYLDELKASATSETTLASGKGLPISQTLSSIETAESDINPTGQASDDRSFERWLFTDWLENNKPAAGRQKEPALPVLKQAKWNSGDNPILAATALITIGVVLTSVLERLSSLLSSL
mmetsp:Transcript_24959/g.69088  ORF Transcript_24959/g.69088 Transcript_24959/m.69088 type:complete len:253 (-) Transcript_24959:47-805(-)|eukprot:CAMPEP_0168729364 /NCGR_PEP_ID=MMETSP0724-20121128/6163_1 /TAXON_ID=265536 /ORGANISM="Amphiprora sp., Strain CCMP467" /LENGTH=252 /DNA_ID=CAMNT_0008776241 /DNA_START=21 /DNA_END=779 /DNA_ORIENTATION=+